jgi:hypothetical protein
MFDSMKKIEITFMFSLIFFSCKKGDDEKYPANPDWLTDKISQMETKQFSNLDSSIIAESELPGFICASQKPEIRPKD